MENTLTIDGKLTGIEGCRNLLEVIRKAGVDLPTFCYHSDLSIYGACRLCIVEVEGRGIVSSCTTIPEPGMVVRTNTGEIRSIRRLMVELLLASHDVNCPSCPRASTCQLLKLSTRLGVSTVRYRRTEEKRPVDDSSEAVVRDPNKCVVCGDCVRMCSEIQGIGALDFAYRGSGVQVGPAFGQPLADVECVDCGQCSAVCPTGALSPKSHVDRVWTALHDPDVKVVAQIAPAVRVAIGEAFGLPPGQTLMGQIVAALRAMGVDRVYDTAFAADLTVLEEGTEFIKRFRSGERLPQFTSCCPAWVKLLEHHYPDLLGNLSSCRSPQQMLASLIRESSEEYLGVPSSKVFLVSIMPCTAKKFEAARAEYAEDGKPQVDAVLTTQELVQMISEAGLDLPSLEPDRMDMPFGFKSGAGVIFGVTGGVSEAVLRYAGELLAGVSTGSVSLKPVEGRDSFKEAVVDIGGREVRIAAVYGLKQARELVEDIQAGRCSYDLVEVMACPGGCVGGAGQPPARDWAARKARGKALHQADMMLQMHRSQDNPYLKQTYLDKLGSPGSEAAHELLHTCYRSRRRTATESVALQSSSEPIVDVKVCVGTNCQIRGSHDLLRHLMSYVESEGVSHLVDISATFCNEVCDRGPTVTVNGKVVEKCSRKQLEEEVEAGLKGVAAACVRHEVSS